MPAVKNARAAKPASRADKPAAAAKSAVAKPAAAKPSSKVPVKKAATKPAAAKAAATKRAAATKPAATKPAAAKAATAKPAAARARRASAAKPAAPPASTARRAPRGGNGVTSVADQLVKGVTRPRDLVMLTREHLQATLDDAAARGRMTRKDANDLVAELVRHGRTQGDALLGEVEALLGRGRAEVGQVARRARRSDPVTRIVRGADRARRSATAFPIAGYDQLRAVQVPEALKGLRRPQLRTVLSHERRNANRKSVVAAIEKALR